MKNEHLHNSASTSRSVRLERIENSGGTTDQGKTGASQRPGAAIHEVSLDGHNPHSIAYLSPKLEGREISPGYRGVFATQPVQAGELLVMWGGVVVTDEEFERLDPLHQHLSIQVEEFLYLTSLADEPPDWVNHSCDPNAGLSGQIGLAALRAIQPGEQVCFDYAMSDSSDYDEFDCQCGSPRCRGHITGNDWRIPELQARYAGYFSPYLQRRIDSTRF